VDAVEPSIGWGVLHLFYRVDRARVDADPQAGKRIVDAVQSLVDDGHQALLFAVLGHKADLGVMALGPDLARLQQFQPGFQPHFPAGQHDDGVGRRGAIDPDP